MGWLIGLLRWPKCFQAIYHMGQPKPLLGHFKMDSYTLIKVASDIGPTWKDWGGV